MIGIGDSSDLRTHPVENMLPTSSVGGFQVLCFLLVHFKICCKDRFPGEDPGEYPEPAVFYRITYG